MAWYHAITRPGQRSLTASASPPAPDEPQAVTAAASPAKGPQAQFIRHPDAWQNEVWDFHDGLGEYNYGVWWLSNMLSRVRLRAAKLKAGSDEPEIQSTGPAAELMMRLHGGVSGQAQMMKRLTVQLSVPGEGYLVGETEGKRESWKVRSVDEVRAQSGKYQVMNEDTVSTGQDWRDLAEDNLVVRVWRPHDRWYHLADSPSRSARSIMRELELVNRKIIADYLSRLASAGVIAVPDEISFPVREEFADAPNPFMAEWIETAAEAIKNPGTASAVIPIPMMGPSEALKEIRFIDFSVQADEKIIEKRDSVIKRLATKMDMPAEVLLGIGDVNHWSAWQLEEGALKTHIAPVAELICDALTAGYLQPRLEAAGEDPSDWVVWYDMSELALRPDRSANAKDAYDRLELSGVAYRRELGFDEDDKPTDDELREQALKVIIHTLPSGAASALAQLIGEDVPQIVPVSPQDPGTAQAVQEGNTPPPGETAPPAATTDKPASGPPDTQENGPPDETDRRAARAARLMQQGGTQHMIRFGVGKRWELLHPKLCTDHEYSCPFTNAIRTGAPSARPGMAGTYLCRLDTFGRLVIDGPAMYADTRSMISTSLIPAVNGHG